MLVSYAYLYGWERYQKTIALPLSYFPTLIGAGNQVRTDDIQIGNLTLYQLSYTRIYLAQV